MNIKTEFQRMSSLNPESNLLFKIYCPKVKEQFFSILNTFFERISENGILYELC